MKNKDLINKIKDSTNNVEVPNLKESIILQTKNLKIEPEEKVLPKSTIIRTNPRWKLAFVVVAMILIVSIALGSVIVTNNKKDQGSGNGNGTENNNTETSAITTLSKAKKSYMVQAITLGGLVDNYNNNMLTLSSNNDYIEISEDINNYLFSIEEIINETKYEYSILESDKIEYANKISVVSKLENVDQSFIIYYNETKKTDSDEDIDEVSSLLSGIMIIDNVSYIIEGEKEVEEDEIEVELRLYLSTNKNKYIKVEQEIENKENEYCYEYYEDGVLKESFEIEKENKNDHIEIELSVNKGGKQYNYNFKWKENKIEIEYDHPKGKGNAKINVNNNKYVYEFDEDIKVEHSRGNNKNNNNKDKMKNI